MDGDRPDAAREPVVVHGDGTSLWTLTHHTDFARDFVGLLGNPRTIGEAFHITSDDVLTWDQIAERSAPPRERTRAWCTSRRKPSPQSTPTGRSASRRQGPLPVFDNTKIRSLVPDRVAPIRFERGAREIVAWHDADPDPPEGGRAVDGPMSRSRNAST